MAIKSNSINAIIKQQIKNYGMETSAKEIGKVLTVGDGIALIAGLDKVMLGELVKFESGTFGMALNLEEEAIGVVLMGSEDKIHEGSKVFRTKKIIETPIGDQLLGRVVNALGEAIDGGKVINKEYSSPVMKIAPGVMSRKEVTQPLETGIIAIDAMIPIGKGQRELIIGDRETGKTAIAIDSIINQKGKNVNCVYVAIGQKNSSVAQIVEKLKNADAMEYTTIVAATASEMAPLQYLAPYTGITIAEEWMKNGKDVLIIYDDLSKHAVAYRTMSLLLRRPPGREAYPGDVFYLHSQLLERAARVTEEYGGGSITALPIVETQAGDISAYIPTNVISITDGQIFTMTDLFNAGQRPAIDAGYSVSRVGSAAQIKAVKSVSGTLKLELANYNEMAAFSQFGSDLDPETRKILSHGKKVLEILKQKQYSPFDQIDQAIILLAVKERLINPVPAENIREYRASLINYFAQDEKAKKLHKQLKKEQAFNPDLEKKFLSEIKSYTETFVSRLSNIDLDNSETKTTKKVEEK